MYCLGRGLKLWDSYMQVLRSQDSMAVHRARLTRQRESCDSCRVQVQMLPAQLAIHKQRGSFWSFPRHQSHGHIWLMQLPHKWKPSPFLQFACHRWEAMTRRVLSAMSNGQISKQMSRYLKLTAFSVTIAWAQAAWLQIERLWKTGSRPFRTHLAHQMQKLRRTPQ